MEDAASDMWRETDTGRECTASSLRLLAVRLLLACASVFVSPRAASARTPQTTRRQRERSASRADDARSTWTTRQGQTMRCSSSSRLLLINCSVRAFPSLLRFSRGSHRRPRCSPHLQAAMERSARKEEKEGEEAAPLLFPPSSFPSWCIRSASSGALAVSSGSLRPIPSGVERQAMCMEDVDQGHARMLECTLASDAYAPLSAADLFLSLSSRRAWSLARSPFSLVCRRIRRPRDRRRRRRWEDGQKKETGTHEMCMLALILLLIPLCLLRFRSDLRVCSRALTHSRSSRSTDSDASSACDSRRCR